ncbi:hypothetical protein NERG_02609 [Nematocida ausubeli]|uniref:Uncharacterized protein n=1 Tax=Nematocida ausubeli (strain ATCC PRA-371 / ERTm2) TaxID=1913371 RepID=H8ZG88_NEMA1|nr:hypothetical protein NERG_02609 [Nematocida ausubeli]
MSEVIREMCAHTLLGYTAVYKTNNKNNKIFKCSVYTQEKTKKIREKEQSDTGKDKKTQECVYRENTDTKTGVQREIK